MFDDTLRRYFALPRSSNFCYIDYEIKPPLRRRIIGGLRNLCSVSDIVKAAV